MLSITRMVLLISLGLSFSSCATFGDKEEKINKEPGAMDLILCEDPRPQICTREYRPVCATLEDGSVETYPTGCTSCSDSAVKSYKLGACG